MARKPTKIDKYDWLTAPPPMESETDYYNFLYDRYEEATSEWTDGNISNLQYLRDLKKLDSYRRELHQEGNLLGMKDTYLRNIFKNQFDMVKTNYLEMDDV